MTLNLIGKQFGRLVVIEKAGRIYESSVWRTLWKCKCLCGKFANKRTVDLRTNKVSSCGCCEWHIHHNEAYVTWMGMKQRCNNKNQKDYPRYGGRGITYDPRWEDFVEFFLDMGDPPKDTITGERLSLDRVNNKGNYTKDNCKWADRSEQQFNRG